MPRTKRQELKRKCDFIIADINNALDMCEYLFNTYYPDYPDYYTFVQTWIEALLAIKESVENFKGMI
jgi:hypothetical protein